MSQMCPGGSFSESPGEGKGPVSGAPKQRLHPSVSGYLGEIPPRGEEQQAFKQQPLHPPTLPPQGRGHCAHRPARAGCPSLKHGSFQALNRVPLFKAFEGRHTLFLPAVPLLGLSPWPAPHTGPREMDPEPTASVLRNSPERPSAGPQGQKPGKSQPCKSGAPEWPPPPQCLCCLQSLL